MQPPTLEQIVERAKGRGQSAVSISVETLERFIEQEKLINRLAAQTGITESDPRLVSWS